MNKLLFVAPIVLLITGIIRTYSSAQTSPNKNALFNKRQNNSPWIYSSNSTLYSKKRVLFLKPLNNSSSQQLIIDREEDETLHGSLRIFWLNRHPVEMRSFILTKILQSIGQHGATKIIKPSEPHLENSKNGLGGAIQGIGNGMGGAIAGIGSGVGNAVESIGQGVGGAIGGIVNGVGVGNQGAGLLPPVNNQSGNAGGIGGAIGNIGSGVGGAVGNIGTGVGGALGSIGMGLGNVLSNLRVDLSLNASIEKLEIRIGKIDLALDVHVRTGQGVNQSLNG